MARKSLFCVLFLIAAGCGDLQSKWGPGAAAPKDMAATELISREVIFGNPDRASPEISPDGTKLAFLAAVNDVLNVWVGPIDDPSSAEPVTQDTKRGIRRYTWAYDNDHILYSQDKNGDENWHVYATNVANKKTRDLTPIDGVQARIQQSSHDHPGEILLAINDRDPALHDIHRVNIASGERTLVQKNEGFAAFLTDDNLKVRMAMKFTPAGGLEILQPANGDDSWTLFTSVPPSDALSTAPVGFDKSGKTLFMIDSRNRNTSALIAYDLENGDRRLLGVNDRADVSGVMQHPTDKRIEAVSFTYERRDWKILDDSIRKDLDYLETVADGDVNVQNRSLDDKQWIVSYLMDDGPVRYYRYDRASRKARFLFTNRKALEDLPLAKMHSQIIEARDGQKLVSYCSLPVWSDPDRDGRPEKAMPMVLFVHGGPWARDNWGLNPYHQWLTNRGYVVLSVNFRGSTGLGKEFTNLANHEWAGTMHNDLMDAVDWAVQNKIADPKRIAIMGGSYGGYATLVGLTFTPDVFACGVDIVGPSNLITLMQNIPPYWRPIMPLLSSRVGDHKTEQGQALLEERSPLTHVAKIKKPLLIGQGANDPRVKQVESDQIVAAMKSKRIPVTYVLFPDEGHGFRRPANSKAFNAVTEGFLAEHLGGRYQPIGDDFKGSSIQVPEGVSGIPGLRAAM